MDEDTKTIGQRVSEKLNLFAPDTCDSFDKDRHFREACDCGLGENHFEILSEANAKTYYYSDIVIQSVGSRPN